ncbi:hypothetical protein KQH82_05735 [bacterium]|nr:hypothetical protein [bacterium]
MKVLCLTASVLLCLTGVAFSQTTLNPDISLIGDMKVFSHNDSTRTDESEKLNLADPEMELYVSGYLNPYASATATVAWHPGANAEIEEIYATFHRGLPLGMNIRAGKYRLEFGRLNTTHPHAYSFIKMPLVHGALLGEEGLNDMAIRSAFLLPTGDAYTELMGAILKGDALQGHSHGEEEESEEEHGHGSDERVDPGFLGRLTTSLAVSESSELAFGATVVNSVYELVEHEHDGEAESEEDPTQLRAWLLGGDIKYKWKPSRYTSLQLEAEAIARREEQHEGDDITSYGGYAYCDYRFRQRYNIGSIVEWLRQKHAHEHEEGEIEIHQMDTWRLGMFAGFAPVEETSLLRLAGHWTEPEEGDGFWEVTLQLVFSLGPHQPHNF